MTWTKVIVAIIGILVVGGVIWYFWGTIISVIGKIADMINNLFSLRPTTQQKVDSIKADTQKEVDRIHAGGVPEQGDW